MQSAARRKGFYLSSILALLVLLLAACGSPSNSNSLTPAPASKQVFRVPTESDFDSLDPALTFGGLGDPFNIIYTNLEGLNDNGTVSDQLAASHSVSADGKTYTFHLRTGLKFSDGTSLDANDVAYSLNRAADPATKSGTSATYLGLLKDFDAFQNGTIKTLIGDSIVVKDPSTIQLILRAPAPYFLEALAYSTGDVVEKSLITKYGTTWTDHLNQGGTSGPFKVQSYGHTSALVLVPNPNYYGFQPKIQKISYVIGSDRDANYKSFQANQFDIAPVPPALDSLAAKKPGYQLVPALATRFIQMNYLAKPFNNIHIRQAFALAINKDLVINRVINTNGAKLVTPTYHIIPQGMPGYNPNLKGPANTTGNAGNATLAKQLLAQGLQEDGYSSVNQLPPITLEGFNNYKAGIDTINAIVAEWKQVLGVTVNVNNVDPNQQLNDINGTKGNGHLQMWYDVWGADYADPQDWLSTHFGKNASFNNENYGINAGQQAVQAELAKADIDQNATERIKLYQDAEQKITNDVGWFETYQSSYGYSVNPKLHGWNLNALGSIATNDWANIFFTV